MFRLNWLTYCVVSVSFYLTAVTPAWSSSRCIDIFYISYQEAYQLYQLEAELTPRQREEPWSIKEYWHGFQKQITNLNGDYFDVSIHEEAIRADKTQGPKKYKALSILGFRKVGEKYEHPSHEMVIKRFIRALDYMKIPREDRILPAVVLARDGSEGREFVFVTPGVDSWPAEPGFRIYGLGKKDAFNLPSDIVIRELKRGRFPLLRARHEIAHLVGFLVQPHYMTILRRLYKDFNPPHLSAGLEYRTAYLNEVLTLADPQKRSEIANTLLVPGTQAYKGHISFEVFRKFFLDLPEDVLYQHASRLFDAYDSLLINFGGGAVDKPEKIFYMYVLNNGFNHFRKFHFQSKHQAQFDVNKLWFDDMSFSVETLRHLMSHFSNDKDFVRQVARLSKYEGYEYYKDLGSPFHNSDGSVRANLSSKDIKGTSLEEAIKHALRLHVARMEFLMWESAHGMTLEKVMSNLLKSKENMDPDFIEFIRSGFGENSELYRSFSR